MVILRNSSEWAAMAAGYADLITDNVAGFPGVATTLW
jgi:hypothetical protein